MEKDAKPTFRKEADEPTLHNATTGSGRLDQTIKAVYRKYGTDLPAFFRDAYAKEIARKNEETANAEVHPA